MDTKKRRFGVQLAIVMLIALLCLLAFAGCELMPEEIEPGTNTTALETTGGDTTTAGNATTATSATTATTAVTTAGTTAVSEPTVDLGGVAPLRTDTGAKIALNPTGLTFSGAVEKKYLDALKTAYGDNQVKVGLLIAPTSSMSGGTINPTGSKTVRFNATTLKTSGSAYCFDATLTNLQGNAVRYSAVAFVEVSGKILRTSAYSDANNARSLNAVAEAALTDLSDGQTTTYKYLVTVGGIKKYSPYTQTQYNAISEIRYPDSITVMSYNVKVYKRKNWEDRDPDTVVQTVLDYAPDIVGFQEVNQIVEKNWAGITTLDAGWDDYLPDLTDHGYTRLAGEYTTDDFEKNEIYFKTDKFTLISEGTKTFKSTASELNVPNPDGADESYDEHGRTFHYAVLQQKATGKKILFVSTHLTYGKTKSNDEASEPYHKVRRYEIRTLLAWLETQKANYPNQIVVGDMNAHYKSGDGKTTMTLYTNGGFSLSCTAAPIKGNVGGTLAASERTTQDQWIFDYILTKGNVAPLSYTVVDNKIDQNNTAYPSDHLPILSKIYLK